MSGSHSSIDSVNKGQTQSRSDVKIDATIAVILLAAGLSERMGRFKPLLPLGKERTIERVVKTFRSTGIRDIHVVTGHRAQDIRRVVSPLNVRCVHNSEYINGMFSSVLAGIRALPTDCRAFFLHPVDIPLVRPITIMHIVAAFEDTPSTILYPSFDGQRGHPTLVRTCLLPEILRWHGNGGLRTFFQDYEDDSADVPVIDESILLDMDTPQDYRRICERMKGLTYGAASIRR